MRPRLLLVLCAVMLAGCPSPQKEGAPAGGTTSGEKKARPSLYRFPLPSDPLSLDPVHITDTVSSAVARQIFNTLVKFDTELNIVNDLAEWHAISDDGLEYKFKLREGVRFHNGDPVTAQDVYYSYKRLVDPANLSERAFWLDYVVGAQEFNRGEADDVEGLQIVDEYTFKFVLKEPFSPFLSVLCLTNFGVVPRSDVERDPDGFGEHPVGTGPFVFDSWQRDDRITLKANRDYFATAPKVQTLIYRVLGDEKTRFEEFKAGQLEHCDIPPSQIREVNNSDHLKSLIQGEPAMDMYCYGFNCDKPPFKDNTALRLAFNHAVDKENIINNIWGGLVTKQGTYVPAGMFYFREGSPGYPYDVEKAKDLLEMAGYPGGEGLSEIVLNIDDQPTNRQVALAVQDDLRQIGVSVRIETTDWGAFLEKVYDGQALFHQNTWLGDYPDPDNWLYVLLHSSQWGALGNITRWENSEFDHFVTEAQTELDGERRAELYRKAEEIAHREAPWLLLLWKNSSTLVQPYVKGLKISKMDRTPQLGNIPMEEVYLED